MDDNLRRPTSTPISKTVERLNGQIEEENRFRAQRAEYERNGIVAGSKIVNAPISYRKTSKIKLDKKALINHILMPITLVGVIVGGVHGLIKKPSDVGFILDYNVDSAIVTQDGEDYDSKIYDITTQNGQHAVLSFYELDEKFQAAINSGPATLDENHTYVSLDGNQTPIGVERYEKYSCPVAVGIANLAVVAGLGGLAINNLTDINKTQSRRRR